MVLYSSGRIVDIALLFVVVELVVLGALHSRTGQGIAAADVAANLLAAVFLLLAVRSALTQQSWLWAAVFLAASFPAHLLDLRRRWNKPPRSPRPGVETGIAPGRGDR